MALSDDIDRELGRRSEAAPPPPALAPPRYDATELSSDLLAAQPRADRRGAEARQRRGRDPREGPADSILRAVIQEDAAVLGLSSLWGAHMEMPRSSAGCCATIDLEDVVFLVGGTIPDDDAERLKSVGVTEVFRPGTPTASIVKFIERRVRGEVAS